MRSRSPDRPRLCGVNKLFLTLIGGGVFDNDPSWIADAIAENFDIIVSSGLDVTVTIFDGARIGAQFVSALSDLARRSNGVIERVD